MNRIVDQLGEVGLPAPVAELAARSWDVVVVGGGHNGLAAAAYLARAGKSVLVLERTGTARRRLHPRAALRRPALRGVSPAPTCWACSTRLVIDELRPADRGLKVFVADPNLWAPFPDGTSLAQWDDDGRTQAGLEALGVSDADIKGYWAYEEVFDDMRKLLRTGARDSWLGVSPTRAELEELIGRDPWMAEILFEASISDVLDHYLSDQRLKDALFGQGSSAPMPVRSDWGTASVKLMHYQGDLRGQGPVWGYVEGGMGMVSFAIADAAREAGAVLAAACRWPRSCRGRACAWRAAS